MDYLVTDLRVLCSVSERSAGTCGIPKCRERRRIMCSGTAPAVLGKLGAATSGRRERNHWYEGDSHGFYNTSTVGSSEVFHGVFGDLGVLGGVGGGVFRAFESTQRRRRISPCTDALGVHGKRRQSRHLMSVNRQYT